MPEQEFFTNDANPQPTGPKISESGMSYYKSLLDDAAWCQRNPAQAALVKTTVDNALALTGQTLEPPTDGRSVAQRQYDKQYGITFSPDGAIKLPDVLAGVVQRDAASEAPDPKTRAQQLKTAGLDPDKVLQQAAAALERAGLQVDPAKLSAHTAAALSHYAAHLQRHQQSRPKS